MKKWLKGRQTKEIFGKPVFFAADVKERVKSM